MNNTHIVIMAGGIGSRFWPMSTPEYPKQFVDVMGCGRTMIQMTVERFAPLCPLENMWVVTSEDYVGIVRSQIPEIPESNILADALVSNVDEFRRIIRGALSFASEGERIVTLGIKPTRPETGYGYIAAGEQIAGSEICTVESFREKPDAETAQKYLDAGTYLWNAGIFIWNVDTIVGSLRRFAPELAAKMDTMAKAFYTADEKKVVGEVFPTCEKISIDYAVMEKADYIYTYPSDFGWSDVGTWGSLWTLLPHDENGNAVVGKNVHLYECKGCIVHAPNASSVVLEGIEDSIVVEREGRILICRMSEEQRIKEFQK